MTRRTIAALLLLISPLPGHSDEPWQITTLEWAQPRHGEWLVRHPGLTAAIGRLQLQPESHLRLRYPGGDEGMLWVEELQAWLVALGIASNRIERVPGSNKADAIQLEVVTP